MSNYFITELSPSDSKGHGLVSGLLKAEGIRKDANLDYTCAIFDDDGNAIATGSCFGSTLRCLAVSSSHKGEGLMNLIVSHLIGVQFARGNTHLFLYTKCSSAKFFANLGFYEIVQIKDQIVFMENRRNGFMEYLAELRAESGLEKDACMHSCAGSAAVIMNANPFTRGHQYLVEKASRENNMVHLFTVREDTSLIPFAVRSRLVKEGTSHLSNIIYHDTGSYMISSAAFPSYFQRDEESVIESQASLDLRIFARIAAALGISRRYVGEESSSFVTSIYNQIMSTELPRNNIECIIVPRLEAGGSVISASSVRMALKSGDINTLSRLVPETTLRYFLSEEATPVIQKIQKTENVIHY